MLHEHYNDFVLKYNIQNGELASQKKLNNSANVLKKEVIDLYNRSEIIRGNFAIEWQPSTLYTEGEIVSYDNKNYRVIDDQDSINEIPFESYKWEETVRADYTMELDPNGYIHKNNEIYYKPVGDYNPATKIYVDNATAIVHRYLDLDEGINFLPMIHDGIIDLDNILNYIPTHEAHPANKKYVDDRVLELITGARITVGQTENSNHLGLRDASQFVTVERKFTGNYNGFAVKNGSEEESINATDWMRSTANGLLPYDQNNGSSLGSELWKWKDIYTNTIHADTFVTTNADIAEKYTSDNTYEVGTVLGIGIDTEVTMFISGMKLAGVVSSNPGYMLNDSIEGISIALKGRVPCKIIGTAVRGDYINASDNGLGIACSVKTNDTIGICINGGKDLIEVKI